MRGPANLDTVQKYASDLDGIAGGKSQLSIAAVSGQHHVIDSIHWSYGADHSTTGDLNVTFGGVAKYRTKNARALGSVGSVEFPGGLYTGTLNEVVLVTLEATDAAVPKVNCTYR